MDEYDVAVVGGGAAGLSAALVLSRARRRVVVIDAGQPRNAPAAHMQGFLSRDGMPPAELVAAGRDEVAAYGGHLLDGTVTGVTPCSPDADGRRLFELSLADGSPLRARRVLVTTGLRDELPDVPGVRERWGRDLLHCPYCHGYEVRDQPLGVLGGTAEAVAHAHLIREWAADVVLFTHGRRSRRTRARGWSPGPSASSRSPSPASSSRTTGSPRRLESGHVVHRNAVFVRPRFVPNDDLLTNLGCATDDNAWVVTDGTGLTSVPGVWVAGNAANPRAQVITAAGEGSAAAIAINNDLVEEDVPIAVARFRAGLPV